jgi:predicted ATPase
MTELSTLRLVGRGAELRRVEGALREFSQGRDSAPALLSVHGEAGVGKTRLIEEAAARENFSEHGRRPLRWIWTRCLPHGPTHPWHPIRALFTSLAGIEPEDLLTDRARKVESAAESHGWPSAAVDAVRYLLSLPTADSAWPDLAPGERQHRLFANLSEILNAIGAEQPTVLCIEDFHWADSVTLQWLDAHLTSQASTRSRSRVLPVVLHRPEFHHLWPAGVHREDVGLKPLSASDSEILLREVFGLDFGSEEKPEPLWSQLVDRTRGNPFFLEEAIRLLLDRGDIEQAPGGGLRLARPAEDILLPESPRGLVEERVSRLERRLRHLLQCASVIGPEVRSPLLAHLADFERDLDAPLRTLMDEQLLKQREAVGGLALLFRHAITQEVTYATVLRRRREELHARLGEYLEERHQGHLEEAAELLAHHYGASNRPQKAMTYLRLAAEHALNLCAHEAAEAHLDRLNATLRSNRDEIADADEAEGWVALTRGRLARLRGDFAGACEILQEAANGAAALNDLSSGLTRVRLLRALGETERQRGHIAEATALQHRALQACERLPAQDPEKRARPEIQREMVQCLMGLAIALRAAGQFDGAMGLLRRAEATAREIGDLRSLASAKNNRGICLMNLGKPQEALKPLEETVSLRRELGDRCNLVPALNNLGIALERLLELDRASPTRSGITGPCWRITSMWASCCSGSTTSARRCVTSTM